MIVLPALVVLLLVLAFALNGDRYGVAATIVGSSVATIILCALFFGWAGRHPGGSFHGFLTAFQLIPATGSSSVYLLGWLLYSIAGSALLLMPLRLITLPRGALGYLVAWSAGLGALLFLLVNVASRNPAVQFFLKYHERTRMEPLLPGDDASFQALVHVALPVVCNPLLEVMFVNGIAELGFLLYLVPLAIPAIRRVAPGLGEARRLRLKQQLFPAVLFLFGFFFLRR